MARFATHTLSALFFATLVGLAPAARAVDGVVLLNQNTSVSGLPGCPHSGFPIIICQPGSYRLSGNLTISDVNTDGIDITADKITLDLNGFTILGPVSCRPGTYPVQCSGSGTGLGIRAQTNNDIAVRNGTVRGMGGGGILLGGGGELVEGVHADQNANASGFGIAITNGTVTRSTVKANAGDGIVTTFAGIVSLNAVSFNGGNGIKGNSTRVNNNSIVRNGQDGIHGAILATFNVVTGNIGFGVANVIGFGGNVITGNGFGPFDGSSISMAFDGTSGTTGVALRNWCGFNC